ncbi:cytochrome C assembly family protein [Cohnella candidum]|uniref:Cytochrome C assembly protein n=1 Tax=Cohnella candidum TaxID=2674991 RepID=A0A3G3JY99_9BACL|nr:cytochrome c biogenesis protein CcsA [Cohnella candidum]AYQ73228.1 cytochrome C assembly protein [Cohnella candidum]
MLTQDWLTDAVLYVYALSLLFFASDAASGSRSARKAGTGLLVFVWVLQTIFLILLLIQRFSVAELSLKDFLFFVSWLLVSLSFLVNRWLRAELLVLFVNVVGFAVLAMNLLQRPHRNFVLSSWEAAKRLLVVHIGLITVSFAVLTVAAILGGMYLFLHERLKKKRWTPVLSRMPSLELIDRYAFRAGLIGVPLLFLSLSTGTAALLLDGRARSLLDEKVLLSFAAGILYVVYLLRRTASGDDGTKVARWNLIGYALLVAAFFANSVSAFHRWM